MKVEEVKFEEKPIVVVEPEPEVKPIANGSGPVKSKFCFLFFGVY